MRGSLRVWFLALLVVTASNGCTTPLTLSYEPGVSFLKAPDLRARKIAVLDFVDARDGMPRNAYGIEIEMLMAELPFTGTQSLEADRSINDYVTAAFRDELKALGAQIAATDGVPHVEFLSTREQAPALHLATVDRVVVGRIRFLQWTQAGYAGLLAQPLMPKPRFNASIQIQVVDPISGRTLWAGEGWALEHSDSVFAFQAEQRTAVRAGLLQALEKIFRNKNFLRALA